MADSLGVYIRVTGSKGGANVESDQATTQLVAVLKKLDGRLDRIRGLVYRVYRGLHAV